MSKSRTVLRVSWKLFKWAFLALLVIVSLFLGRVVWRSHSGLPDHDTAVRSAKINSEVRVVRDTWGVPHIQAESEPDAYFALGYCMAQDRLFQMEVMRRLACGELAELLGPPVVKIDRIMRAFRLRAKADEFVEQSRERSTPEMNAAMDAFIAGVNDYVENNTLPWEFAALMISCRPFTVADFVSVAAILPITFADGLRCDPLKSVLKERLPEADVDMIFRGIEKTPVTIMESLEEAAAFQRESATLEGETPQAAGGFESAARWLDAIAEYARFAGTHLGSNSWVLSGDKTASGKPILGNDPHIGFTNPCIWYEAHLKYGDVENYGYHLPPIPMALLGHNEDRGWGLTMFSNDDVDMYLEKVNPDNPNQVMYQGKWVECEIIREVIRVRFGRDVVCDVRITPHGPIANDLLGFLLEYEGPPISMCWVWQHVQYTDVDAFYDMSHARDYDRFEAAVRKITSPGLNISYADAAGNIAWWAAGLLPVRPAHVDHKALLEGWTGRDEFTQYLPFESSPHLKNPPGGMIVTANNLCTVKPLGTPPLQVPFLQGYFKPSDRAGRIEELLEPRNDWTIEGLRAVQNDVLGYSPRATAPVLARLARADEALLGPLERQALEHVEDWDFRNEISSVGATVFNYWMDSLLQVIFGDEMTSRQLAMYASLDDSWIVIQDLLVETECPWWDDVTTPERETAARITARALKQACEKIAGDLGDNVDAWQWGKTHTITFTHPFGYLPGLGRLLNIGPFPCPGARETVNNMPVASAHQYDVIAGPSTRRLIDFARPDQSLTILPTGNSGHVGHRHYDDQAALFVRGDYRTALYNWDEIKAAKEHEMRFLPQKP